jgi:hypothetical protein
MYELTHRTADCAGTWKSKSKPAGGCFEYWYECDRCGARTCGLTCEIGSAVAYDNAMGSLLARLTRQGGTPND